MAEKILIITYDMIPYSGAWGGAQRMYFLAEHLFKNGYDVTVISAKKDFNGYFGKKINFNTIYLESNLINMAYKLFRSNKNEKMKINNGSVSKRSTNNFKKVIENNIKKMLMFYNNINLNEPSSTQGILGLIWLSGNKNKILDFINKNKINKVIISGPPFSLFKLTSYIKKMDKNIKVILDYRDPWNLWNMKKGKPFKKEQKFLKEADYIVGFSELFCQDMVKIFPFIGDKITTVMNGYSSEEWSDVEKETKENKNKNKLIISYVGTISFNKDNKHNKYSATDPYPLLSAFTDFDNKNNVELRFVGINKLTKDIEEIKKNYKNVNFFYQVSHKDSLNEMKNSDVLILIYNSKANSSRYMITGKFFDYLKSGKLLLGIGNEETYFNKLIENYKLGLIANNDEKEIEKALNTIYSFWKEGRLNELRKDENLEIEEFSRESQNDKYLTILEKF